VQGRAKILNGVNVIQDQNKVLTEIEKQGIETEETMRDANKNLVN